MLQIWHDFSHLQTLIVNISEMNGDINKHEMAISTTVRFLLHLAKNWWTFGPLTTTD